MQPVLRVMDQSRPVEEQYLLRVADPALAQRLGEVMRGPGGADLMAAQLNFNGEALAA